MGFNPLPKGVKLVAFNGAVNTTPFNAVLGAGFFYYESIGRGAPCATPCSDQQGSRVGELAFAALQGFFDEYGSG